MTLLLAQKIDWTNSLSLKDQCRGLPKHSFYRNARLSGLVVCYMDIDSSTYISYIYPEGFRQKRVVYSDLLAFALVVRLLEVFV